QVAFPQSALVSVVVLHLQHLLMYCGDLIVAHYFRIARLLAADPQRDDHRTERRKSAQKTSLILEEIVRCKSFRQLEIHACWLPACHALRWGQLMCEQFLREF